MTLISRLEEAGEGSRELDALIWLAYNPSGEIDLKRTGRTEVLAWRCRLPGSVRSSWTCPDAYSTSLDAALALAERVLPGLCWSIGQNVHHKHWTAYALHILPDGEVEAIGLDSAKAPALALCIAILRALPNYQEKNNVG